MSGQQQHQPLGPTDRGTSAATGGGGRGAPTALERPSLQRGPSLARTSTPGHSRAGSLAGAASGTLDDASIAAAQELASIMNQPAAAPTSWLGAWPWAQALVAEDYDAPPPPLPPGTLPEVGACRAPPHASGLLSGPVVYLWCQWPRRVPDAGAGALPRVAPRFRLCCSSGQQVTIGDFSRYLRSVGERLEVLERSREASQQRMQEALSPGTRTSGWLPTCLHHLGRWLFSARQVQT